MPTPIGYAPPQSLSGFMSGSTAAGSSQIPIPDWAAPHISPEKWQQLVAEATAASQSDTPPGAGMSSPGIVRSWGQTTPEQRFTSILNATAARALPQGVVSPFSQTGTNIAQLGFLGAGIGSALANIGAGAVAGAGSSAGGSASTFPLAAGGPVSVSPLAGGAATAAGGGMNPLLLSSLISAGGSLLGGKIQGDAAGDAADLSREMFQANRELLNPFVQGGYAGNAKLADLLGLTEGGSGELVQPFDAERFEQYKDPGYDFRLRQGEQALLNKASAGSGAFSGAAIKDLLAYNQDMASTEYGNAFNRYQVQQGNIFSRLSDIARLGQSSAAGVGSAGTQAAATGGQAIMNQGSAYGGGVVGAGGAAGDAATNYWLFNTPAGRATWGGG